MIQTNALYDAEKTSKLKHLIGIDSECDSETKKCSLTIMVSDDVPTPVNEKLV